MEKLYLALGSEQLEEKVAQGTAHEYQLVGKYSSNHSISNVLKSINEVDIVVLRESVFKKESLLNFVNIIKINWSDCRIIIIEDSDATHDIEFYDMCGSNRIFDLLTGPITLKSIVDYIKNPRTYDTLMGKVSERIQEYIQQPAPIKQSKENEEDLCLTYDYLINDYSEINEPPANRVRFTPPFINKITGTFNRQEVSDEIEIVLDNSSIGDIFVKKVNIEDAETLCVVEASEELDIAQQSNEDTKVISSSGVEEKELMRAVMPLEEYTNEKPQADRKSSANKKNTGEINGTNIILFSISHSLFSQQAINFAASLSKDFSVLYLESDLRNMIYKDRLKSFIYKRAEQMLDEVLWAKLQNKYDYIVVNISFDERYNQLMGVANKTFIEITQDLYVPIMHEFITCNKIENLRLYATYFNNDIQSENLDLLINRDSGLKLINTLAQEFESRRSGILFNDLETTLPTLKIEF